MTLDPAHHRLHSTNAGRTRILRTTVALATLGIFVTYLPINGVGVALLTIGSDLGAGNSDLQWITDAYVIPMAISVLPAGYFGDRYGRRRLYVLGLALTAVGATIAAIAGLMAGSGLAVLWGGQAVAGVGAGLLIPTTLALIAYAEPDPRRRGPLIGKWATGTVAGLAVGPVLSGVLLEAVAWGWIFVPTAVLAVVLAVIARRRLEESVALTRRPLDLSGLVSVSIAIGLIVFGVIEGGVSGWVSVQALAGLGGGTVALVVFLITESRSAAPLVDLHLFRSGGFSAATLSAVVALFSIVGMMFVLSVFLGSDQLSALEIGLRLVFVPGVAALTNPLVGRLMRRVQPILVLCVGLLVAVLGMLLLTGVDAATSYIDLVWRLAIFGVSTALMLTSLTVVAVNAAPHHLTGMAAATSTALRQIGGALGPAVLGTVYVVSTSGGAASADGLSASALTTVGVLSVAFVACAVVMISQRVQAR